MPIKSEIRQGKDVFILVCTNPVTYYKKNRSMGDKTFSYYPCNICGKLISNAGWAYMNHYKMHMRNEEYQDGKTFELK